ncbi:MAG: response regulator [Blastocatellia bacterium]
MCTPEHPCTLLLVEDDSDQVTLFEAILALDGQGGFKLRHTDNVKDALEILEEGGIDLMLLDLNVRDSLGLDTQDRFAQYKNKVPIVVMTNYSDLSIALEATRRGAQEYIVKGDVSGRSLLRIVHITIERHRIVSDLHEMCADLNEQLRVLREPASDSHPEAFERIQKIADRMEARAAKIGSRS